MCLVTFGANRRMVEMRAGQKRKSEEKVFPRLRFGSYGVERRFLAFGETT